MSLGFVWGCVSFRCFTVRAWEGGEAAAFSFILGMQGYFHDPDLEWGGGAGAEERESQETKVHN